MEASSFHDNAADRNPYPYPAREHHTILSRLYPYLSLCIPLMSVLPFSISISILLTHLHQSIQVFRRIRRRSKSLITDGPRGIYCVVVVGSDGDASALDVGRELVEGALGEVAMLAAAVLVVVLELPLKFLGPGQQRSQALGGDLGTGLGATQFATAPWRDSSIEES